jgi:predicted site-specific integrase-resolvase
MNTLLTPTQVAEFLGITIGTLSVWRCTGRYPLSFIKVGRRVMYRQSDVESFIEGRVYEHTL